MLLQFRVFCSVLRITDTLNIYGFILSTQEKQILKMLELLDDDVPEVRIVAIEGVVRVLSRLWIILSSQEINRLVKFLIHELAFDASSPSVRQAVLKGMTFLVRFAQI